jgi:hypothetical protein
VTQQARDNVPAARQICIAVSVLFDVWHASR